MNLSSSESAHPASQSAHPAYRADIDGLRAVAILSVLIFHGFPSLLPGGFIGVDIFFVISGFLISSIIIKGNWNGTFTFSNFYARRIKRIAPALVTVLAACLIFGWFGLLSDEFRELGVHVVAGIGFVSNLLLWSESGYFDSASELKPLLHLWSLGIEEQFYIVWPIIVVVCVRLKLTLLPSIVALLLASLVYCLLTVSSDPVAGFYSPLSRAWELLAGALLAYFSLKRTAADGMRSGTLPGAIRLNSLNSLLSVIGVCLIVSGFVLIHEDKAFPGAWALLPVMGATLLIAAGPTAWVNHYLLSNRIMVWFGLISYPLYLWHWPLLSLANVSLGDQAPPLVRAALLLMAILLAWLTYRFIEKPVRHGAVRWPVTQVLIFLMLLLAIIALVVARSNGMPNRAAVFNSDFTPEVAAQFTGDQWQYTANEECLNTYPFEKAKSFDWWFCMKSSDRDTTIAIVGNSFANQLYPGFINNERLAHHTFLSIGTCDLAIEPWNRGKHSHPCYQDNHVEQVRFIDDLIINSASIEYVVLGSVNAVDDQGYIRRLREKIDLYEKAGKKVIVFNPHLRPVQNPKSCFTTPIRRSPQDCTIPLENRLKLNDLFEPIQSALAESHPSALIFDQNSIFCDDVSCYGTHEGMPMHRDMVHTSEYAAILLQQSFNEWAETAIPELFNRD